MGNGRRGSSRSKAGALTSADGVISYRDNKGRLHVAWRGNNTPATEIEQVTGWSYADGHTPRHRGRCGL